jgi:hypothetical protein
VISKDVFLRCKSLSSAPFESGSQVSQLAKESFLWSSLTSIHLPASVTVIGKFSFSHCRSLASIPFDPASKFCGNAADLLAACHSAKLICARQPHSSMVNPEENSTSRVNLDFLSINLKERLFDGAFHVMNATSALFCRIRIEIDLREE